MTLVAGFDEPIQVLIVDADPVQRRMVSAHLAARPGDRFTPFAYASKAEAMLHVGDGSRHIILADLETVGGVGEIAGFESGDQKVIATSSRGSVHAAVAAIRAGAVDFLPKPFGAAALVDRLEAAILNWKRPEAGAAASSLLPREDFEGFIGRAPEMLLLYDQLARIAPSKAPVFVTGESGTGKELCAEAIHARSGRADRKFVAINCGAIPKDLMESEIFGHVRGAFTGATETRAGAAELADGGTLFLDEIGELDLNLQTKLLRFLQSGSVQRVGDTTARKVDVRIVCATNRNPLVEVAAGRFREDLFYRLHVLPLHLPPLRERATDIVPLASAFLARYATEEGRGFRGFAAEAAARLAAYPWPGNVRELQNVIRRIVVLHQGSEISLAMLPPPVRNGSPMAAADTVKAMSVTALTEPLPPVRLEAIQPFWEQERTIIEAAVEAFGGNISRAAAALEISPSTIYRKRQAWLDRRTA